MATVYVRQVGGALFLVAANTDSPTPGSVQQLGLFLLQGFTVQEIGPVDPALAGAAGWSGISRPDVFGSYACVALAPAGTSAIWVYAYDVVRGRLFKIATFNGNANVHTAIDQMRIAATAQFSRTAPTVFQADWGVIVPVLATGNVFNVQEIFIGVRNVSANAVFRQGCSFTSSLIDYTLNSSNKLYQQVVASHDPITANTSVILNVWLDQDPESLNAIPDFTITHNFVASDPAPKQTLLPINRLGRKLVYQAIVTNSSGFIGGSLVSAPKLFSVAVQAATGWVWTINFDLNPNVKVNSGNSSDYCFAKQGADHVLGYNFLKNLWRQKAGLCIMSSANGDVYPAKMQDLHMDSPKFFAPSQRSDQRTSYQSAGYLKIREDI